MLWLVLTGRGLVFESLAPGGFPTLGCGSQRTPLPPDYIYVTNTSTRLSSGKQASPDPHKAHRLPSCHFLALSGVFGLLFLDLLLLLWTAGARRFLPEHCYWPLCASPASSGRGRLGWGAAFETGAARVETLRRARCGAGHRACRLKPAFQAGGVICALEFRAEGGAALAGGTASCAMRSAARAG